MLKLQWAGAYSAPAGRDFPPHRHNCWELVLYRTGRIEAPVGDEMFVTRPGLLLATPPGVVHSERALTAYSNFYILVDAPPDPTFWPRAVENDVHDRLGAIFSALVHEWTYPAFQREAMSVALLTQLDIQLRRCVREKWESPAQQTVRAAEQFFAAHFAQSIDLRVVAAAIGVAPSTLRAHFATERGYSPLTGLQKVRMQHALALLSGSNLTLQAVANASGYYSPSHLSRHVKAATGQRPGEYRFQSRK